MLKVEDAGKSVGQEQGGPVRAAQVLPAAYPSAEVGPCKPDAVQSAAQSFVAQALAGVLAESLPPVFVQKSGVQESVYPSWAVAAD